jgi:hypothetical protein
MSDQPVIRDGLKADGGDMTTQMTVAEHDVHRIGDAHIEFGAECPQRGASTALLAQAQRLLAAPAAPCAA